MINKNINYIKYFLELIKDFDESTVLNPNLGGVETFELDDEKLIIQNDVLKDFCSKNSISENVLFLGSVCLTLNKFNFSNKNLIFHENNTIFTTNFENREISIEDYLLQIQKDYEENLKYANFSIDNLIKEYDLKSGIYYSFNKDLDISSNNYDYDFYINISENQDIFIISASYNNQLYSREYINLFLRSIKEIIHQFLSINISNSKLFEICLVEEDEEFKFNEIETPFIHKLFEKQVEKNPDHIALISNGKQLTYDELNKKANKIANALIKRGVKPKSNILIMFHRTSDLIASILGVLKAGCAYIPIDMAFPKERIYYMYQNSQADYILSENDDFENSMNVNELLKEKNTENPNISMSPDDLAYILYTSGSTGKPKGVMGSHRNVTSGYTENKNNIISNVFSRINKNLGLVTVSFVAFLSDFMSLTFGNTLLFANDEEVKNIESLVQLIQKEKPDALTFTTPSRIKQYMEYEPFKKEFSTINKICMGGELVTKDVLSMLQTNNKEIEIYIAYGCTEVTGIGTLEKVTDINKELTIGTSPFNTVSEIRDNDGNILPPGVMGEIYIGGYGVSQGYYNLDTKSQESFITINNIPFYKTGDFGIRNSEGKLILKGRIDNQIKLRGLRIEIGEIE